MKLDNNDFPKTSTCKIKQNRGTKPVKDNTDFINK